LCCGCRAFFFVEDGTLGLIRTRSLVKKST
jgi:hypothetical protein